MLNAVEHANFFENRATEYSKASTTGTWEEAFDAPVFDGPGFDAPSSDTRVIDSDAQAAALVAKGTYDSGGAAQV
jgi:hypothetical protein